MARITKNGLPSEVVGNVGFFAHSYQSKIIKQSSTNFTGNRNCPYFFKNK